MSNNIHPINSNLTKQLATRAKFPDGHVISIAYTRVFGPKHAATPEGHPIQISSGPFDNTVKSALQAIMDAAVKWAGIMPNESAWELEMEEDVIQPLGRPPIPYSRVYYFIYKPEQQLWHDLQIHEKVANHFKSSHYLTSNWRVRMVNTLSAKELKAPATSPVAVPASTDINKGGQ